MFAADDRDRGSGRKGQVEHTKFEDRTSESGRSGADLVMDLPKRGGGADSRFLRQLTLGRREEPFPAFHPTARDLPIPGQ